MFTNVKLMLLAIGSCFINVIYAQDYSQYFIDGVNAFAENRYSDGVKAYQVGAERGDKYCCGRLAALYCYGLGGITQNIPEARKWAMKGYELGNSFSAAVLGYTYIIEYGMNSEVGMTKSLPYLIYAYDAEDAEKENAELYANLGLIIASQKMIWKEVEGAKYWMNKALSDYPTFVPLLGWVSYVHWGEEDYTSAVKYATEADKEGNIQASFVLGWCMAHGKGIIKNEQAGFKKMKKAALLGFANFDVMFALGECCFNGIGTSVDKAKAKEYYQKAADEGSVEAQEKLDMYYDE